MKMFITGKLNVPPIECELDEVLEEIEDLPTLEENGMSKDPTFLGLEREDHTTLIVVKVNDGVYSVVFSKAEKDGFDKEAIESLLKDYFDGKIPDWAKDSEGNDFPDGLDELLEGNL